MGVSSIHIIEIVLIQLQQLRLIMFTVKLHIKHCLFIYYPNILLVLNKVYTRKHFLELFNTQWCFIFVVGTIYSQRINSMLGNKVELVPRINWFRLLRFV